MESKRETWGQTERQRGSVCARDNERRRDRKDGQRDRVGQRPLRKRKSPGIGPSGREENNGVRIGDGR